ncbi:hypothetical protein [Haloarcula marina]|nr:hypothetical protein [Halomicroarcula marina]
MGCGTVRRGDDAALAFQTTARVGGNETVLRETVSPCDRGPTTDGMCL